MLEQRHISYLLFSRRPVCWNRWCHSEVPNDAEIEAMKADRAENLKPILEIWLFFLNLYQKQWIWVKKWHYFNILATPMMYYTSTHMFVRNNITRYHCHYIDMRWWCRFWAINLYVPDLRQKINTSFKNLLQSMQVLLNKFTKIKWRDF